MSLPSQSCKGGAMKKALISLLCGLGLLVTARGQSSVATPATDFGFRFATNVTAKSYTWTNDNSFPFYISSMTFNSDAAVTASVTLARAHSRTRQYYGGAVTTNYWGEVETNYTYVITNTVYYYATNELLSVTNTGTIHTDIPKVYLLPEDELTWDFGVTNTLSILFDGIR